MNVLLPPKNNARGTLDSGIDASQTTFDFASADGQFFPAPASDGSFLVLIWNYTDYPNPSDQHNAYVKGTETEDAEYILVGARSTDACSSCTRGQEGTTATTHNKSGKSYKIALALSAATINTIDTYLGGAALSKTDDTNVTLTLGGSATTALLRAASITLGWTGTLADGRIASAATWNAKQPAGDYITALTGDVTASGPGSVASTIGALKVATGMIQANAVTLAKFDASTSTAGQILRSGASASPTWSTATYPATAGTAANYLRSDGTNFVSHTLDAGDIASRSNLAGTSNQITLSASGANALVGGNTITLSLPQDIATGSTVTFGKMILSGLALNTDATNTIATLDGAFSITKNDANTRTFSGIKLKPTLNTGASNTNTTLNFIELDSTNTAVTGLTVNLIKASYGGTQEFLVTSGGVADLATGYRINGGATSGNVLRGNGTNFVSSTLAASDIASGAALTKGDDTNVTLTLGGTPSTALLAATSITAGWTGQLGMSRGGTNANLTASNGGIFYSTSTAGAILAGTATAGKMLRSGANAAPTWSSSTYPSSSSVSGIFLISDGTNWVVSSYGLPTGIPSSGTFFISDGTNVNASGYTFPSTITAGDVFYSSSSSVMSKLAAVADGSVLSSRGTSTAPAYKTLLGTSNQITVTSNSGDFTFSTPQNIHTSATPQFARIGLGQAADGTSPLAILGSGTAVNIFMNNGGVAGNYGGGIRGYSVASQGGYVALGTYQNSQTLTDVITINHNSMIGLGTTAPTVRAHIVAAASGYVTAMIIQNNQTNVSGTGIRVDFGMDDTLANQQARIEITRRNTSTGVTDFDIQTWDGSAMTSRLFCDSLGSVIIGKKAALATNATAGFVYIPTSAGAPTGAPTAFTGKVAMEYDTTNNNLYVYNGAWKKVAMA